MEVSCSGQVEEDVGW